jgi:hypothetical protein
MRTVIGQKNGPVTRVGATALDEIASEVSATSSARSAHFQQQRELHFRDGFRVFQSPWPTPTSRLIAAEPLSQAVTKGVILELHSVSTGDEQ